MVNVPSHSLARSLSHQRIGLLTLIYKTEGIGACKLILLEGSSEFCKLLTTATRTYILTEEGVSVSPYSKEMAHMSFEDGE